MGVARSGHSSGEENVCLRVRKEHRKQVTGNGFGNTPRKMGGNTPRKAGRQIVLIPVREDESGGRGEGVGGRVS